MHIVSLFIVKSFFFRLSFSSSSYDFSTSLIEQVAYVLRSFF